MTRKKIILIILLFVITFIFYLTQEPTVDAVKTSSIETADQTDAAALSNGIKEITTDIKEIKILFILLAVSMIFYLPIFCVIAFFIIRRWRRGGKRNVGFIAYEEKAILDATESPILMLYPAVRPEDIEPDKDSQNPVAMYEESGNCAVTFLLNSREEAVEVTEITYIPTECDVPDSEGCTPENKQKSEPMAKERKIHPRKTGRRKEKNYAKSASRKKDRRKKRDKPESVESSAIPENALP